MKRIIPLELVGLQKFDFDLYDENGNIVYEKGENVTPDLMMLLSQKKIFISSDKHKADVPQVLPACPVNQEKVEAKEILSAISQKATKELLTNTKKILQESLEGKNPDISICEATRDIVLNEVSEKIEKIECIGQLRVFDEYTFSHTVNVSSITSALAITLDFKEKDVEDIALGALLHDIGKMRVPLMILNKPGKLNDEEFMYMKSHPLLGYRIIKEEMKLPEHIALIALQHQEKYGGKGYPDGLKGNEISLFAQVTSIADVYDALVSKRVYKQPLPSHEAIRIMMDEGSKSFNPFILYKFLYLANHKSTGGLVITREQFQ
jgi:putative nucleotidyltransferase with HDIG domain